MKVHVLHCKVGHVYHMTGVQALEPHFFVYVGRDKDRYYFRMISSCNTDESRTKVARIKKFKPGSIVDLTAQSADCLSHDSYIDITFCISMTLDQLKKKFSARTITDGVMLRETDFQDLLFKMNTRSTPHKAVRESATYNSIHAL